MPRKGPDRVALQTHVPLPRGFRRSRCPAAFARGLFRPGAGGRGLLNLCLVSRPRDLAGGQALGGEESSRSRPIIDWRTIAPLARAALPAASPGCFWSATRRGWLSRLPAKEFTTPFVPGNWRRKRSSLGRPGSYAAAHRKLYAGRLWINALARLAVEHPRLTSTVCCGFLPNEQAECSGF